MLRAVAPKGECWLTQPTSDLDRRFQAGGMHFGRLLQPVTLGETRDPAH